MNLKDEDIVYQEGNQYKRESLTIYAKDVEELRPFVKACLEDKEKFEAFLDFIERFESV